MKENITKITIDENKLREIVKQFEDMMGFNYPSLNNKSEYYLFMSWTTFEEFAKKIEVKSDYNVFLDGVYKVFCECLLKYKDFRHITCEYHGYEIKIDDSLNFGEVEIRKYL